MAWRSSFSPLIGFSTVAWVAALALAPWWIDFPLLLAMVAALCLLEYRLAPEHRLLLRRGLNWGLPGALFALQRVLGGDVFAWVIALLGVLAGYTLLAGLEAWLDRDLRRAKATAMVAVDDSSGAETPGQPLSPHPSSARTSSEWPALALASIGPAAEIIELQLPVWYTNSDVAEADTDSGTRSIEDPHGGRAIYRDGSYLFDDGTCIEHVASTAAFSPRGCWFVARMTGDRGIVLHDRELRRLHRLRGWQLDGWHHEQPWLIRSDSDMPLALHAVLGEDASDEERPV